MRYLAIDPGERRSGLAAGDDETGVVVPLESVTAANEARLVAEIRRRIDEQGPDGLVIGLPLNMDGTEGDAARRARALGERLGRESGRPVHFQDERLTTFAADQQMARSGRSRREKKAARDAFAAAEILRDFLHARR